MASRTICSRCLSVPGPSFRTALAIEPLAARSFTSSASRPAAKKGKTPAPMRKQGGSFNKGKSLTGAAGKRAKETAALSIREELMADQPTLRNVKTFAPDDLALDGEPRKYSPATLTALSSFGLPRPLHKEFAAGPATTVVREDTVRLYDRIQKSAQGEKGSKRILLSGARGSGKSTLVLQCAAASHLARCITIYIPRASEWVTSSAAYQYSAETQTFHQTTLSARLLGAIGGANAQQLGELKLGEDVKLGKVRSGDEETIVRAGKSLKELCDVGAKEELLAARALAALFTELEKQTQFQVLLAIDEVQALFADSQIQDPQGRKVPSWGLSGARLFLDFISGRRAFSRGVTLSAISLSDPVHLLTSELIQGAGLKSSRVISPYDPLDATYIELARGVKEDARPSVFRVEGKLAVLEAAAMVRAWREMEVLRPTDELFLGKYAESGGNAREFRRSMFASMAV